MKIKKLTVAEFWPIFDKYRPQLFGETHSYSARDVRTLHEKISIDTLLTGTKSRHEVHLGLFDAKGAIAGWSSSHQVKPMELYMMNSAVFPKFRRKGYYTKMVQQTLKEAKKLGFQTVTSNHVASNNAVIIAKLKLGFKITGFELSDEYGVLVRLTHFLNPTRALANEYRAGEIKPTKELKKLFKI